MSGHHSGASLYSSVSSSTVTDQSFVFSQTSSPRSSIYVDCDSQRFSSNMSFNEDAEDVSAVMTQVLGRMERIVEHFREKGENDAANSIAKNTISTVNIINETIAPWDMETAILRPPHLVLPVDAARDAGPNTLQGVTALSSTAAISATSWASVAAVAPTIGNNKIIKFTPEDALQTNFREPQPVTAIAEVESDQRVVWIRGWSPDKPLGDITDRIGQGPIYSMAYSEKDSAVCIIFQNARSARALYTDDKQYTKQKGHSRFGPGCDVVEGLAFANNDDLKRMSPPFNERRRLTFARSQLFTNGLTEEKFRSDIYSIVGKKNIELVWLFNTGNATVVTSAVPLARLVRNEFLKIARSSGSAYRGVVISFSHDPCERAMTLITQMNAGRPTRPVTTYGRSGAMPAELSVRNGSSDRGNNIAEANGWQTVSRRR